MEQITSNCTPASTATSLHQEDIAPEQTEKERQLKTYVQKIKVAVAMAIIRSTPLDTTPENYARSLVQAYSNNVRTWKTKCQDLERHVFSLEQKLQTMSLKGKAKISEHFDIMRDDTTCFNIPPMHQSSPAQNRYTNIHEAMEFIRSFIILGSITMDVDSGELPDQHQKDLVLKSVSSLLGYLRSEEGLELDFNVAEKALGEIHTLMDSRLNNFEKELVDHSIAFVDSILLDIYRTMEINKVDLQHRRSALIQVIASHRCLKIPVLCRLLREITVMADFFEALFRPENDDLEPLLRSENTYYFLQATEGIVSNLSPLDSIRMPKDALNEWDKTTEKSLLTLGTVLPMFSLYVWHIKSSMKAIFSKAPDH